jgi:hypothetical protein
LLDEELADARLQKRLTWKAHADGAVSSAKKTIVYVQFMRGRKEHFPSAAMFNKAQKRLEIGVPTDSGGAASLA